MNTKNNSGFTMVEIIAVLIVMGIITAFAVGRVADNKPELVAQKEVLKVHLRYAQSRAMNSNDSYGIQSDVTGHTYELFRYDGTFVDIVNFPGEGDNINLSALGLSMTTGITVSFDSRGIPYTNNSGTRQTGDRTLTLSSGTDNESIIITQNTGFIQ